MILCNEISCLWTWSSETTWCKRDSIPFHINAVGDVSSTFSSFWRRKSKLSASEASSKYIWAIVFLGVLIFDLCVLIMDLWISIWDLFFLTGGLDTNFCALTTFLNLFTVWDDFGLGLALLGGHFFASSWNSGILVIIFLDTVFLFYDPLWKVIFSISCIFCNTFTNNRTMMNIIFSPKLQISLSLMTFCSLIEISSCKLSCNKAWMTSSFPTFGSKWVGNPAASSPSSMYSASTSSDFVVWWHWGNHFFDYIINLKCKYYLNREYLQARL